MNDVKKQSVQFGFTLIEVLIALAIISASFTTLFRMFHQSEMNNQKVGEIYTQTMIEKNIFAELSVLNPVKSVSGHGQSGNISYQWNAVPLSPLMQVRSEDNSNSSHIQLYRVDVTYQQAGNSNTLKSFSFEKLGWESKLN